MTDIIAPDGRAARAETVRIHEVDFPVATTDLEQLKAACLVPVYQPGIVSLGSQSGRVTDPSGRQAQVVVGHAVGFNGGQALIIRETAAALEQLRVHNERLRGGLQLALECIVKLADEVAIGKDGQTVTRLREIVEQTRALQVLLDPDANVASG